MIDDAGRGWPDWLGGVVLLAPLFLAVGVETYGEDRSKFFGVAALLLIASALLVQALVAPLVGYRRTSVVWSFLPFWGWAIAWRLGTRLARLSRTGSWEDIGVPTVAGSQR